MASASVILVDLSSIPESPPNYLTSLIKVSIFSVSFSISSVVMVSVFFLVYSVSTFSSSVISVFSVYSFFLLNSSLSISRAYLLIS